MCSRIIKGAIFVGIATALPLAGIPHLILHPKIIVLAIAAFTMLLSQPTFSGGDAKQKESTDRWSVLTILGAGMVSQVAPIVDWGYWHTDHSGNLYVTALGLCLIAGGLAFRIWSIHTLGKFFTATVQIVDGHRVIKHGPYAIVRHPSYLGAYLAIVGSGLFLNSIVGTIIGAVVMFIAYVHRLKAEEATLLAAFGEEYEEYRKTTPMVVPRLVLGNGIGTSESVKKHVCTGLVIAVVSFLTYPISTVWAVDNDHDGLADEVEDMLIARHAPYYLFDAGEQHWPAGVVWYVQRSSLKLSRPVRYYTDSYGNCQPVFEQVTVFPRTSNDPSEPTTQSHPEAILNFKYSGVNYCGGTFQTASDITVSDADKASRTRYHLDPPDESWVYRGQTVDFTDGSENFRIPANRHIGLYAHVTKYMSSTEGKLIVVQYLQFFPKNNVYGSPFDIGWHEADWEYLEVLLKDDQSSDYPVLAVIYHHHGDNRCSPSIVTSSYCDGMCGKSTSWIQSPVNRLSDIFVYGTKHPKCYIEAGSHEWYPYPSNGESCAQQFWFGDFVHRGNGLQYQTASIPNLGEIDYVMPDNSCNIPLESKLVLRFSGKWGDDNSENDPPAGPIYMEGIGNYFGCNPYDFWNQPSVDQPDAIALSSPSDNATCRAVNGTLSWKPFAGENMYRLRVGLNSSLASNLIVNQDISGTSYGYGPLQANTTYYWQVSTPQQCSLPIVSQIYSFTTEDPIPPPPTQFQPADFAANQLPSGTLSWLPVSGASSYGVQIKCLNGDIAASGKVTTDEFIYSLPIGDYTWSVVSYNSCSHPGARSTIQHFSISTGHQTVIPKHVYPLDGSSCIGEVDTLRWDPVPGASGYMVFFKDRCEDGNKGTRTTSNFLPVRLDRGRDYYWRVTEDAPCAPIGSCLHFKTQADPNRMRVSEMLAPANGAKDQPTSVTLSWQLSNATKDAGSPERCLVQLWNVNGDTINLSANLASATVNDLLEGTTYFWHVAIVDSCGGQSRYSDTWSFTTILTTGINRVYVDPGQRIAPGELKHEIVISAENLVDVGGYRLRIMTDPNVIVYRGWTTDGTRSPILIQPNMHYDAGHGRLDIEAYTSSTRKCNPGIPTGNGPILRLLFDVLPTAPLQPTAITFDGTNEFRDCAGHGITAKAFSGVVDVSNLSCCTGAVGNIDCDPSGTIDIVDLTRLIDNLFISLSPPCCDKAADLNLDGVVDIADLTALINFLFIGLDPVPSCDTAVSATEPLIADRASYSVEIDQSTTIITVSSSTDLRGVQLQLVGTGSDEPISLTSRSLEMVSSRHGDSISLGVFDRHGTTVIAAGRQSIVSIPGSYKVVRAVASDLSNRRVLLSAGSTGGSVPGIFQLSQNYPNPFNPTTTISFSLLTAGDYDLTIYNTAGQTVRTFSGRAETGLTNVFWDAREFASGIYFYRLTAGELTETKKMILLK